MIEDLRKKLKEDVWKLINNENVEDKDENSFIIIVLSILLEKQSFSLEEAMCIVKKLKKAYDNALKHTDKLILEDYGEIISIIKEVFKSFDEEIRYIVDKIKGV